MLRCMTAQDTILNFIFTVSNRKVVIRDLKTRVFRGKLEALSRFCSVGDVTWGCDLFLFYLQKCTCGMQMLGV